MSADERQSFARAHYFLLTEPQGVIDLLARKKSMTAPVIYNDHPALGSEGRILREAA